MFVWDGLTSTSTEKKVYFCKLIEKYCEDKTHVYASQIAQNGLWKMYSESISKN